MPDTGLMGLPPGPDPRLPVWEILLEDEQATRDMARFIADELRPGDLVTLSGGLGAGKTTLAPRDRARARGRCEPGSAQPHLHPDADLRHAQGARRPRRLLSSGLLRRADRDGLGRGHRRRHRAGGMAGQGRLSRWARGSDIRLTSFRGRAQARGGGDGDLGAAVAPSGERLVPPARFKPARAAPAGPARGAAVDRQLQGLRAVDEARRRDRRC